MFMNLLIATTRDDSHDANDLHDLFSKTLSSTHVILTYSIPLILVSVLLTFAGAFLTLDRTRSFIPRKQVTLSPKRRICSHDVFSLLEGGVGGLAAGFAFGVHLATFLALLIPTTSSAAPLDYQAFLAVCLLSAFVCSFAAGRWKYVAFALLGATGCACFSLALSVILHPTLLTRIVLTSILTVLGAVLCLIPLPKLDHIPIRFAASAAGSFGLVLCISLLADIPAWGNIWARLWVGNDIEWGTVKEKALSSTYCILVACGIVCDWLLHRFIGENPDEKWDHYLADYEDNLPNDKHRAGIFQPSVSLWTRIFGRSTNTHSPLPNAVDIEDWDTKLPPPSLLPPERSHSKKDRSLMLDNFSDFKPPVSALRQPRKKGFILSHIGRPHGRKLQFSPQESDLATLVDDDEAPAKVSSPSVEIGGNAQLTDRPSTSHPDGAWLQFWRDVRLKHEGVPR